ncbi:MAG: hypothetical protein JXA21_16840 [Anaerolineae bacterium]|nr:hypothetical protein [Anaerolineae bacterium]
MANEHIVKDTLPENFNSLETFWEFWDTHSSADYEDLMEDVEVEVAVEGRKVYCAIARDLLQQIRDRARRQGVSAETLINMWLQEKVAAPTWGGVYDRM